MNGSSARPRAGLRVSAPVVETEEDAHWWLVTEKSIDEVLKYLPYDAWRQRVVRLTVQLEPKFMRKFSDKYCFGLSA